MATILSPDVIQELGSEELKPKWEIKKSPISGRGLFATEPIKRGSIIMSNKPLVIGPRADIAGEAFCSNCYNICDSHQTCEKCSLLVCSNECEDSEGHAKECQFIVQNWKRKHNNENNSKILGQVLVYIRFLLLTQEQKEFLNVLQKTDHQCKNEELEMLCSNYVIPEEQLKFMKTTSSVLKINSFRISANTIEQKVTLRGLYPLSAFLNHSCMPNTRTVFKKDYSMSVYASKDIEIGEEILICYTGLLWCTPARRCQLYKTKQFWCKCARCQDLTEMGTKLSALKCMDKQCQGLLLPVTPLNPATEWNCDICSSVVSPERVSAIQSVLGSLVGTLDLDNQLQLDSIVVERLAIFIPYYNHIFVDISLRTALKIGYNRLKLNELSESRLGLKESLCRGILRTVAALGLGDARLRGLLLYHLHAALAERARRSPHLFEELKSEIESTIEQAYNILHDDISAPPDLELRRRYLGSGCDKPHEERFFLLQS